MSLISLDLNQARLTTEAFSSSGNTLDDVCGHLQQQWSSLSSIWEGDSKYDVASGVHAVLNHGRYCAEFTRERSTKLTQIADRFQAADENEPAPVSPVLWGGMVAAAMAAILQGAPQQGDKLEFDPEFFLLRGQETEFYGKYLKGEMTLDELMKEITEDPFKPDLLKTDVTLYTLLDEKQSGGAAVAQGSLLGDSLQWSALSADWETSQEIKLGKDGLTAKADFEAGAYLGKAELNTVVAGVAVTGLAYMGATASGSVEAKFNPLNGDAKLGAKLDAFAGGRIEGSANKEFDVAGVETNVGVQGSLSYGIGAKFDAEVGFDQGHFKAEVDIGATLGLGAEIGFSVDVDAQEAAEKVVGLGKDLVEGAVDWMFSL